jgi:hypothetical protein
VLDGVAAASSPTGEPPQPDRWPPGDVLGDVELVCWRELGRLGRCGWRPGRGRRRADRLSGLSIEWEGTGPGRGMGWGYGTEIPSRLRACRHARGLHTLASQTKPAARLCAGAQHCPKPCHHQQHRTHSPAYLGIDSRTKPGAWTSTVPALSDATPPSAPAPLGPICIRPESVTTLARPNTCCCAAASSALSAARRVLRGVTRPLLLVLLAYVCTPSLALPPRSVREPLRRSRMEGTRRTRVRVVEGAQDPAKLVVAAGTSRPRAASMRLKRPWRLPLLFCVRVLVSRGWLGGAGTLAW